MNTITWATIIVDAGSLTDACSLARGCRVPLERSHATPCQMGDDVDAAASIEVYCTQVAAEASFIAGRRIDCVARPTSEDAIEYERCGDEHVVTVDRQYLHSIVNAMGEEQDGSGDDPELVRIAASATVALERIFAEGDWYVGREV